MTNKPGSRNPITPSQLLIAAAILVVMTLINIWNQRSNQESPLPPAITPIQSIPLTDTPAQPAGHPSTVTPVVGNPPRESLGEFDYFVLALSWSPDYCASSGGDDPQQCSLGRKLGFVLHGLWPQYNQGYPSDCTTEKMTAAVKAQFPGLYPSDQLFDHEWEKHGTCTGLSPTGYLALSKRLKESVAIPAAYRSPESPFRTTPEKLKKDFIQSNQGFPSPSLAVYCSSNGRYLKELYVCFSREGQPAACGDDVLKSAQKSCQSPDFLVRNIR